MVLLYNQAHRGWVCNCRCRYGTAIIIFLLTYNVRIRRSTDVLLGNGLNIAIHSIAPWVINGMKWPGEITDSTYYTQAGWMPPLPKFVHWITKEVLNRFLVKAKFRVEHLSYINRSGQFPDYLIMRWQRKYRSCCCYTF